MKSIKWLVFFLFPISVLAKDVGGNLGLGGSKLFNTSLSQGLLFNPSNNSQKFVLGVDADLAASESLINLSKEDTKIEPGTYQARLSPYYGKENRAEGVAGVTIGYKGLLISPLLYLADGEAILNNPAYPNAAALVHMGQGWGIGYGNKIGRWNFGLSRSVFNVKTIESSANVLEYRSGVINNNQEYPATLWNFALGYDFKFLQLVGSYQTNDLRFIPDHQFNVGLKTASWSNFTGTVEIHDLNNGISNLENQMHVGINYQLLDFINLEAGLNQLYPTYGIRFKSRLIQIYYEKGGANQYEQYRNQYDITKVGFSLGWNLP